MIPVDYLLPYSERPPYNDPKKIKSGYIYPEIVKLVLEHDGNVYVCISPSSNEYSATIPVTFPKGTTPSYIMRSKKSIRGMIKDGRLIKYVLETEENEQKVTPMVTLFMENGNRVDIYVLSEFFFLARQSPGHSKGEYYIEFIPPSEVSKEELMKAIRRIPLSVFPEGTRDNAYVKELYGVETQG